MMVGDGNKRQFVFLAADDKLRSLCFFFVSLSVCLFASSFFSSFTFGVLVICVLQDEAEEACSNRVERDRESRARIRRLRRAAQLGLSAAGKKAIKARQQRR